MLVHFVSTDPQQVFEPDIYHFVNEVRNPLQTMESCLVRRDILFIDRHKHLKIGVPFF